VSDSTVSAYPSKIVGIGLDPHQRIFFLCSRWPIFPSYLPASTYGNSKKSTNGVSSTETMHTRASNVHLRYIAPH
jgi:hypothetical protein